jgi:hypothetical protein
MMPGPQCKGVCFACGFEHWEDSCPVCERMQSERDENTRLRTIAEAATRLVATLPKCGHCDQPATRAYQRSGFRFCDTHGEGVPEYSRASALRDTIAALAALDREFLPEPDHGEPVVTRSDT